MKTNTAFFPFCKQHLPLIRHFSDTSKYNLTTLITWKGMSMDGKDASHFCEYPTTGMCVTSNINPADPDWSTILIDWDCLAYNMNSTLNMESIVKDCLTHGKHITLIGKNYDEMPEWAFSNKGNISILIEGDFTYDEPFDDVEFMPLPIPVIMVGGLVNCVDTLETIYALRDEFGKNGYRVSCITSSNASMITGLHSYNHIFDNYTLPEGEKANRLNCFARNIIHMEHPEILIVESPDAVMRYNDVIPNGFGIRTYMLSQALEPDLFIGCLPYDLANDEFVGFLNDDFIGRYGFSISAVQVSNMAIDAVNSIEDKSISCIYTGSDKVYEAIHSSTGVIPMFSVVFDGAEKLYKHLHSLIG